MEKILNLEPFSRIYLDKSFDWCNDPIIQKLILGSPVSKEQQEDWYKSLPNRTDYKIWGVSCNGVPVGSCGLKQIEGNHGAYWGYIGEKEYWGGLGTQLVTLVENKARELNLKRIYLCVSHENHRARHLYKKLKYIETHKDEIFSYFYKDLN